MPLLRALPLAGALLGARAAASSLQPVPGSWHAWEVSREHPRLDRVPVRQDPVSRELPSELIRTAVSLTTPRPTGGKVSLKTDSRANDSRIEALSDHHTNRIIVIPEYKLFFCGIDHNYFSNFSMLFDGLGHNTEHSRHSASEPGKSTVTMKDIKRIFRDKTWHKAVFVRDPVERFLSAVLMRCTHNAAECSDPGNSSHRLSFTRTVVSALEEFAAARGRRDAGMELQVNYCGGLGKVVDLYDTVALAKPAMLRARVVEMLTKVGANRFRGAEFDRYFPDLGPECPQCRPYLAMFLEAGLPKLGELLPIFPEARAWVPLRGRSEVVTHARIVDLLLNMFEPDYAQLGMAKPAWARRIIGEGDRIILQRRTRRKQRRRAASKGALESNGTVEHSHVVDDPEEKEDRDAGEREARDDVKVYDHELEEVEFNEASGLNVATTAPKLASKRRFERNQTLPALGFLASAADLAASQPAAASLPASSRVASFSEAPVGATPASAPMGNDAGTSRPRVDPALDNRSDG